ncbi:putative Fungal STAND N-terminal Goodbye domain-containing protein [Seiridium cardinale]|uniref:Fungal STAND N-terminal Goodbye domain-containing protein n=1 Tax=Seiridium cardinale TaxID=138064 RepID=A0ABR2XT68_9PEZI
MATTSAPPVEGLSSRSRILTNSAAEFLELRSDEALGAELAETSPEFVPELDRFVTRDEVPPQDYFAESQKQVETFKQTLALFQKNLIQRKVDQKYEIEIKDANSYTLEDVLKIAQTVQKKHKDADQVHSCMGRLKKFFHATGRNATTFKKLLAFVPDDVYGSVICGGFTVILGSLERLEKLRTDIYAALDKIPETLHRIRNLLNVHYQSPRLKQYGDAVLVAIFVLLERIVRELSGSLGKKILIAPVKGERYGVTVDEAVKSLEEAVKSFETEGKICDSQRLGQVDIVTKRTLVNTARLDVTTKNTEQEVRQINQGLTNMASRQEIFVEQLRADQAAVDQKLLANTEEVLDQLKQAQLTTEKHGAQVHQVFYCFLTANPSFDSKTGTLDQYQAQRRLIRALTPVSMASDDDQAAKPKPFSDANKSLVKALIKASGNAPRVANEDLRQCLGDLSATPSPAEQDRVTYILTSPELRDWLRSTESGLMAVDLNSDMRGEHSVGSYASSVMIRSIQKVDSFPILYHFCAVRGAAPDHTDLAGAAGLYISLIAQLLRHLRQGPNVDLEFLDSVRRRLRKDKCKTRELRRAFKELTQKLSKEDWLYIVVDSLWKIQYSDGEEEAQEVLKLIKTDDTKIRLFITDPFSLGILEPLMAWEKRRERKARDRKADQPKSRIITLQVPDRVDGHHGGFNLSWIKEEVDGLVEECMSSQVDSNSEVESKADVASSDDGSSDDAKSTLEQYSSTYLAGTIEI